MPQQYPIDTTYHTLNNYPFPVYQLYFVNLCALLEGMLLTLQTHVFLPRGGGGRNE